MITDTPQTMLEDAHDLPYICEGACEVRNDGHRGAVQRVRVSCNGSDWGEFNYCQQAIAEDRKNGFTVKLICLTGQDDTGFMGLA